MSLRLSQKDAENFGFAEKKKSSKYRNKRTARGFDSKKEERRFDELVMLEACGKIRNLKRQVPIELFVLGKKIGKIVIDFGYEENGTIVYEDVKSPVTVTPIFKWKSKHFEAQTGCKIKLTF